MKKIINRIRGTREGEKNGIDNKTFEEDTKDSSLAASKALKIAEPVINGTKPAENAQEGKEWSLYTRREKIVYISLASSRIIGFIVLLYLFLLSLNFMTIGFTLVTPYAIKAGPAIKFILSNPFAALAIGIIATAIMQNATATTSIAVAMVGAKIIPDVKSAIPIVMGANIGTCMPNSLIALSIGGSPQEFKRAFSGATLNDGFNLLTTSVLLPIEIFSSVLNIISEKFADALPLDNPSAMASANFISFILNPVIDLFILLDVDAVNAVSNGSDTTQVALRCCSKLNVTLNLTTSTRVSSILNSTVVDAQNYTTICVRECSYWCMPMLKSFGDGGTGLFWIILSLVVVIACLFLIVKVLSDLVVGPIAKGVRIAVNYSFPGKFKWTTEILLFVISLLITIVVQSSNIITATLVPLCGIGIISLQRVFTLTLGSNIGTTVTGILTAFTLPPTAIKPAMQLAFVYTLFNTLGVVFWLPIPFMRFPKTYARALGEITFKYRWFVWFYVFGVYLIIPAIVFCLALIPMWIGLAIFGLPTVLLIIFLLIRLVFLAKCPARLPDKLKDLKWLPIWLRSLQPYDKKVQKLSQYKCCKCLRNKPTSNDAEANGEDMQETSLGNVFRRVSVISGLVEEARAYTRRNTLASINETEDDTEKRSEKKVKLETIPSTENGAYDNTAYTKQI